MSGTVTRTCGCEPMGRCRSCNRLPVSSLRELPICIDTDTFKLLYSTPRPDPSSRQDVLERALQLVAQDARLGARAGGFRTLQRQGRFFWDRRCKTLAQYNGLTGTLKLNPDKAGVDMDYRIALFRILAAEDLDIALRQDKACKVQAQEFHRDVRVAAALVHEMNHRELGVHPWDRRRDERLAYQDEIQFYDAVAQRYARRSDDVATVDAQKVAMLTWLQHARADAVLTARTQEGIDLQ